MKPPISRPTQGPKPAIHVINAVSSDDVTAWIKSGAVVTLKEWLKNKNAASNNGAAVH